MRGDLTRNQEEDLATDLLTGFMLAACGLLCGIVAWTNLERQQLLVLALLAAAAALLVGTQMMQAVFAEWQSHQKDTRDLVCLALWKILCCCLFFCAHANANHRSAAGPQARARPRVRANAV